MFGTSAFRFHFFTHFNGGGVCCRHHKVVTFKDWLMMRTIRWFLTRIQGVDWVSDVQEEGGGTRDGMGQETWGDSPGLIINDIPTGVVYMISQLAGSTVAWSWSSVLLRVTTVVKAFLRLPVLCRILIIVCKRWWRRGCIVRWWS